MPASHITGTKEAREESLSPSGSHAQLLGLQSRLHQIHMNLGHKPPAVGCGCFSDQKSKSGGRTTETWGKSLWNPAWILDVTVKAWQGCPCNRAHNSMLTILPPKWGENTYHIILEGQYNSNTKATHTRQRKVKSSILYEHWCENHQQNTSKQDSAAYQED